MLQIKKNRLMNAIFNKIYFVILKKNYLTVHKYAKSTSRSRQKPDA